MAEIARGVYCFEGGGIAYTKAYNIEKLDSFLGGNFPENGPLTVIIYTVEGDPIKHGIAYSENSCRIKSIAATAATGTACLTHRLSK
ncbi:MAG: hypothetical protein ACOX8S_06505 [Christensenellales bacterium]